jgi:hypothetical protein
MGPGSDDKISCALTTGTHNAITIIAQQPSTISAEVSGTGCHLLPVIFFVITHNPFSAQHMDQSPSVAASGAFSGAKCLL